MIWLRRAICGGAIGWTVLIPLAAFGASRPGGWQSARAAAAFPYAVGAVICHQQAVRSFALWSEQLPVCARCTGLYAGAALVALFAAFPKAVQRSPGPPKRGTREGASSARTIVLVAALPTMATLVYEWSTGTAPSNMLRAISGLPLGAAVAWAILTAVDDQVN